MFEHPIILEANIKYCFEGLISGPPSWYGSGCPSRIEHSSGSHFFTVAEQRHALLLKKDNFLNLNLHWTNSQNSCSIIHEKGHVMLKATFNHPAMWCCASQVFTQKAIPWIAARRTYEFDTSTNTSYEKPQGVFSVPWSKPCLTWFEVRNFDQIYVDHMSKDAKKKKTHKLFLLSVHVSCTRYVLVLS